MRVLAIDTALGQCAACVLESGGIAPLAHEAILMERGHAEALLPLVERVMSRVEGGFAGLDRVVVTIGPGSFTGLRVGISAARAIGLATGRPVVGVTTLSALVAPFLERTRSQAIAAAIDARHGRAYAQIVGSGGRIVLPASLLPNRDVVRLLGSGTVTLVGSAARALAAEAASNGLDAQVPDGPPVPDVAWVARLGIAANAAEALAKPLYLTPPDARPQDSARLARQ